MLNRPQSDSSSLTLPAHDTYDYLPGSSNNGLILLADHAGAALPEGYGSLGLGSEQFERHIAYDIGVRGVVSHLAGALRVPAIFGKYSRLLIDLNRGADDPTLLMKLSDGAVVPGNANADLSEKTNRITRYHRPYHDAVSALVDHELACGRVPVLLSIHSFTPAWKGVARPWHASVLWDSDERLVAPLLSGLRAEEGFNIGDNVPYSGELEGDTLNQHGTVRGIAHALVEIRQDLIADAGAQEEWGLRLARIMRNVMMDEDFIASIQVSG